MPQSVFPSRAIEQYDISESVRVERDAESALDDFRHYSIAYYELAERLLAELERVTAKKRQVETQRIIDRAKRKLVKEPEETKE